MRFVVLRGENNLDDLIRAHFGDLEASEMKRVETLMLALNPELKNMRDLHPGAVIRLPVLDERNASRESIDVMTLRRDELLDQLDRFTDQLKAAIKSETELLDKDKSGLDSDTVRNADQSIELRPLIDGAQRGVDQRQASLDHAQKFVDLLPKIRDALGKMLVLM